MNNCAFDMGGSMKKRTKILLFTPVAIMEMIKAIDLLNLNKALLFTQFKAISSGCLIYEADSDMTSVFLENILQRYHDRGYRYRVFFQDWDEGLRNVSHFTPAPTAAARCLQ